MDENLKDWVHKVYSIEKYLAAYSGTVYLVKNPKFCPKRENLCFLSPNQFQIKEKG